MSAKSAKPATPYNLYVRAISHKGKSCPCCKAKLDGDTVYSAGEYINVRWHNVVDRFCRKCFDQIPPIVRRFKERSGRDVAIVGYRGEKVEDWMKV